MIELNNNYYNVHIWLNYHFGKANCCSNKMCENKSNNYQWALIKGRQYEKNKDNFIMLCRSCHAKYDTTKHSRKIACESNKGRISPHRRKIVLINGSCKIAIFDFIKLASDLLKINRTAIMNNLSGLSKKTKLGVFKYLE